MKRVATIIFDLDGTLTKPNLDFDVIRREIGVSGPLLEAIGEMPADERRRAESILLRHEWQAAQSAELHDGAQEVIQSCRSMGFPVAILTRNARPMLDFILETHGIVVDAKRSREDEPVKPSPAPVLSICQELSADPKKSWVVGDFLFDIQCGRRAGARTVLMMGESPRPEFADEADHTIRHLSELLSIVEYRS